MFTEVFIPPSTAAPIVVTAFLLALLTADVAPLTLDLAFPNTPPILFIIFFIGAKAFFIILNAVVNTFEMNLPTGAKAFFYEADYPTHC